MKCEQRTEESERFCPVGVWGKKVTGEQPGVLPTVCPRKSEKSSVATPEGGRKKAISWEVGSERQRVG